MKKVVLMGVLLVAAISFGAQAQTTSPGNSGTGNGTNGSAAQTGTTDSSTTTGSTTGTRSRMNKKSDPSNMNSMSSDQSGNSMSDGSTSTQGKGRKMKRSKMKSDSTSGNTQRP